MIYKKGRLTIDGFSTDYLAKKFGTPIYCYSSNKIAGILLLMSISFISPNLYKNFKGELYPITIIIFASYFGYIFGIRRFKKWKSSL